MSSLRPSQIVWAARDRDPDPDLGPGPARRSVRTTLAEVARRAANGEDHHSARRDFLDGYALAPLEGRPALLIDCPAPVTPRLDAYLGALAEHLASRDGFRVPAWAGDPGRFLDHFWWPSTTAGLRAIALVQSPAAFRRRGIFIGATTLARV